MTRNRMDNSKRYSHTESIEFCYDASPQGMSLPTFHYHNAYEIYFLKSGNRKLYVNDSVFETTRNDIYMLEPYMLHRSSGNTPFSGYCVTFHEKYIEKYFSAHTKALFLSTFANTVIALTDEDSLRVEQILSQAVDAGEEWKFSYLPELFRIFDKYSIAKKFYEGTSSYGRVHEIIDYIDMNFRKIRSIDEIAKKFFISKNYLCSLFKQHTGMTLINYINSLRIQYACYYLTNHDRPMSVVASACGFESNTYFGRIFKLFMGVTPSQYKKLYQTPESMM